eukprot:1141515-Pelagomonas_calceolata.AAC.13
MLHLPSHQDRVLVHAAGISTLQLLSSASVLRMMMMMASGHPHALFKPLGMQADRLPRSLFP